MTDEQLAGAYREVRLKSMMFIGELHTRGYVITNADGRPVQKPQRGLEVVIKKSVIKEI